MALRGGESAARGLEKHIYLSAPSHPDVNTHTHTHTHTHTYLKCIQTHADH